MSSLAVKKRNLSAAALVAKFASARKPVQKIATLLSEVHVIA